jgi:hypothetical protein
MCTASIHPNKTLYPQLKQEKRPYRGMATVILEIWTKDGGISDVTCWTSGTKRACWHQLVPRTAYGCEGSSFTTRQFSVTWWRTVTTLNIQRFTEWHTSIWQVVIMSERLDVQWSIWKEMIIADVQRLYAWWSFARRRTQTSGASVRYKHSQTDTHINHAHTHTYTQLCFMPWRFACIETLLNNNFELCVELPGVLEAKNNLCHSIHSHALSGVSHVPETDYWCWSCSSCSVSMIGVVDDLCFLCVFRRPVACLCGVKI